MKCRHEKDIAVPHSAQNGGASGMGTARERRWWQPGWQAGLGHREGEQKGSATFLKWWGEAAGI